MSSRILSHKIPETKNPKMRIIEIQGPTRGEDGLPIITLEADLTPEFIEWLKGVGGLDQEYIDRLGSWIKDAY